MLADEELDRVSSSVLPAHLIGFVSGVALIDHPIFQVEFLLRDLLDFALKFPGPVLLLTDLASKQTPRHHESVLVDSSEFALLDVLVPNVVLLFGLDAEEVYHVEMGERNYLDEIVVRHKADSIHVV